MCYKKIVYMSNNCVSLFIYIEDYIYLHHSRYILFSLVLTRLRIPSVQYRSKCTFQLHALRRLQNCAQQCNAILIWIASRMTSSCKKRQAILIDWLDDTSLSTYLFRVRSLKGFSCLVDSEITHVIVHEDELNCRFTKTHIGWLGDVF